MALKIVGACLNTLICLNEFKNQIITLFIHYTITLTL